MGCAGEAGGRPPALGVTLQDHRQALAGFADRGDVLAPQAQRSGREMHQHGGVGEPVGQVRLVAPEGVGTLHGGPSEASTIRLSRCRPPPEHWNNASNGLWALGPDRPGGDQSRNVVDTRTFKSFIKILPTLISTDI
jgi:hypothetical protein